MIPSMKEIIGVQTRTFDDVFWRIIPEIGSWCDQMKSYLGIIASSGWLYLFLDMMTLVVE